MSGWFDKDDDDNADDEEKTTSVTEKIESSDRPKERMKAKLAIDSDCQLPQGSIIGDENKDCCKQ